MDDLDREQYLTRRLPTVRTDDGPTARYMAWLAELDARVMPLIPEQAVSDVAEEVGVA